MSEDKIKPRFGGIPFRAVADGELTAYDLRLLATISAHDGFNKNRRGCFASHKRLAALTKAHYKTTARTIAKLIDRDYLHASQQGADGRLRVYRVMYTQEDHEAFRGDGRSHAPAKALRSVTEIVTDKGGESVTKAVTDYPEAHDEVGNRGDSGSVTENGEVGNQNDPPTGSNALISNDERSRIYYTESKGIKNRRDLAEAPLSERAMEVSETLKPPPSETAATLYSVIHRAVLRPKRKREGPATDADAAIDQAIHRAKHGEPAPVVDNPLMREARPSTALLENALCLKARATG
jgi:DNA-binding MarR family transcriptional regulator